MGLPQIKLDERTFQNLVDETKLRIPRYCPEWTNHNVSDPGVTLIELFAYMVDQLLYQINRVPEKNYRAFLDMIGVRLAPPNAASTNLTFWLSSPQINPLIIPKGTQVGTTRGESTEARIFTTDEDLVVMPPKLRYVLNTANSQSFTNWSNAALDRYPRPINVFQDEPQPGNAFYLGFDEDISRNTLVVGLDCEKFGVGINPNDPPLIWEYWDEKQVDWMSVEVARDTSGGLTYPFSEVELYIPLTAGQRELELVPGDGEPLLARWIRCRYAELAKGQAGYNKSPVINRFSAHTIGGSVGATHSLVIKLEEIGRSSGEPGQKFKLLNSPILNLNSNEGETIVIFPLNDLPPEEWKQVPDFSASGPFDKHFMCDPVTSEISFGPSIRNPKGEADQLGAAPVFGSRIVMAAYRTGGGTVGNVGTHSVTTLKNSIPYVDHVTNLRPASGGTNPESLEHALMRGPRTLRARNRAVTMEDYQILTREATSGVARVRCLTPGSIDRVDSNEDSRIEPGTVVLVVVPEVQDEIRELRPEHVNTSANMRAAILNYLEDRRLITTQVEVVNPKYQWVTAQVRIKTTSQFANERVKREAERRMYRFIRPVQGGPDPTLRFETPGEGWPFGRVLYISEIYSILQTIEGVEFVEKVELFPVVDMARGQAGAPTQMIDPGPLGLRCSDRHQIVII